MLELPDCRSVRVQGQDARAPRCGTNYSRAASPHPNPPPPAGEGENDAQKTGQGQNGCLMFNPSQTESRRFFCEVFRKLRDREILSPLEAMMAAWIVQHPEYDTLLADPESALAADFSPERGDSNPFLHLAMHLSIAEQISIDQPKGVREAFTTLSRKLDSEHDAHHIMMEALGEMIWNSQRNDLPPDGNTYLTALIRKAGLKE
jgi:hypothetical protein